MKIKTMNLLSEANIILISKIGTNVRKQDYQFISFMNMSKKKILTEIIVNKIY